MMESLNRTVEHSVSWRALQWRWTALRTGKPFAEIVLLNTLEYRVEQVFLIHAETGLLLQHVSSDAARRQDADQISAMLTAIRDFARDSFKVGGGDSARRAARRRAVGDRSSRGRTRSWPAWCAASAPHDVRATFQDALESVHRQFGPELQAFRGDAAPFERARPDARGLPRHPVPPRERKARRIARWALAAAVARAGGRRRGRSWRCASGSAGTRISIA